MIPPGFIAELLSRTDIADVVGQHVELKRGGANLMGLCPFHTEKSPSFSVSPSKQFFHCFGCGASGDAIRFLTEHLGLSFVESVRDLAQRVGLLVPEEQVSADEQARRSTLRERRQSLGEVLAKAAAFYRSTLGETPRAIAYLKQRGLTGAVARRFELGFAPPGWRALANVFARYDDPLLEEAGLVRRRPDDPAPGDAAAHHDAQGGNTHVPGVAATEDDAVDGDGDTGRPRDTKRGRYDWFRDRVMFPIRSVTGDVIGFGGRVLGDDKPKYMNSPETPVFSKGRELYGLFEARQALRDRGHALVVEGYMDVVALAQHGFGNAVATLGTACTAEHIQKLFRFTDAVVFAFDGDAAGRRAAGRALEAALPHASDLRNVRFLFLPPEHDPDSFVRTLGAPAFETALAAAVPLSRQLIDYAADGSDLGTAEGRARMLAQARPLWQALPDGALKRQLLPELARQGQLTPDDLTNLWGGAVKRDHAGASKRSNVAGASAPRRSGAGGRIGTAGGRLPAATADLALRLLLRHSDWWDRLAPADQQLLHGLEGAHGEAIAWFEQQVTEHGTRTWAALEAALQGGPLHAVARGWVEAAAPEEEQWFEDLQRVLHRLWRAHLEAQVEALLVDGNTDRERLDRIALLHRRIDVHRTGERAPAT